MLFLRIQVAKGSDMVHVHQIVERKLRAQAMKSTLPLNINPWLFIQQSRGLQCVTAAATTDKHNEQVSPTPQLIQQYEEQICKKRIRIHVSPTVGRSYGQLMLACCLHFSWWFCIEFYTGPTCWGTQGGCFCGVYNQRLFFTCQTKSAWTEKWALLVSMYKQTPAPNPTLTTGDSPVLLPNPPNHKIPRTD